MPIRLPKIYPITDSHLSGLSHAEQVTRLIGGGATFIQLREKYDSPQYFLRTAAAALDVAEKSNVQIIINDRVDIAMALNAGGVHLGQMDLPANAARRLLRDAAIIGVSTHNLPQVEIAARFSVDYIAFGPIFATGTKANPDPTVGLALLRAARKIVGNLPLVAIGGITSENCLQVLEAGADSVAIVSGLVADSAAIAKNLRRMLALTGT